MTNEQINLDEYEDLTNDYIHQNLDKKIEEIKKTKLIVKGKICLGTSLYGATIKNINGIQVITLPLNEVIFSKIDDLIIYFPNGMRFETTSFEKCEFKKLIIQNHPKYNDITIKNIEFNNCKFEEKIIIDLNKFSIIDSNLISNIHFKSDDKKQKQI